MSTLAYAPLQLPALASTLFAGLRSLASALFAPQDDADLQRLYRLASDNDSVSPELIAVLDTLNRN